MNKKQKIDAVKINEFEQSYDSNLEDKANRTRGDFLDAFPKRGLKNIKLKDYVIGLQSPTFCTHVEVKTRQWANIQGSSSNKFGIYYGKTKSDPEKIYRFTRKFGETADMAFVSVKAALLELISLGEAKLLDFVKIDANPLSQMFKAKILSLYFPDRFLNICSREHLEVLGTKFGYLAGRPSSEYQHLLLETKLSNTKTQMWSNPKFMEFLYNSYIQTEVKPAEFAQKPRKKVFKKVNFEDIQNQRDAIGKAAEDFAIEWEKQRLNGAELSHLIEKIDDRRDRPGFGYDFLSHTSDKQQRYIEVKSVKKLTNGEGHRFFLSDNELTVSKSADHQGSYFFYLVFFGKNQQPTNLEPILAEDMYKLGEMSSASYIVRFDLGHA
ncbi:MAG: DUF3883 domain-containing protein [Burkholderiaceae bacterium]|nr:DUF3883 domain-containing protein [Burkholderiaceae bacterium]